MPDGTPPQSEGAQVNTEKLIIKTAENGKRLVELYEELELLEDELDSLNEENKTIKEQIIEKYGARIDGTTYLPPDIIDLIRKNKAFYEFGAVKEIGS